MTNITTAARIAARLICAWVERSYPEMAFAVAYIEWRFM